VYRQGRQIARALAVLPTGLGGAFQQTTRIGRAVNPDIVAVQQFLPDGILPRNMRGARHLEEQ